MAARAGYAPSDILPKNTLPKYLLPFTVTLFRSASRECCGPLTGASGTAHLDHYAERLEIAFGEREHETARDILGRACRREDGAAFAELEDLRRRSGQTYLSVLRDLEADGYVKHEGSRLKFRSNLLRKWWRKYHDRGVAP